MASNASLLHVKVENPERVIWEGDADSVSSVNSIGPFDILPDHANMITLIEKQPITVVASSHEQTFSFEKAVILVRQNLVSIFADIISDDIYRAMGAPRET